jgi:hypothetical protein
MDLKRRTLGKLFLCAVAFTGLSPSFAAGQKNSNESAQSAQSTSGADTEKSIKASFGGGFSMLTHSKSDGITYARIENFGNEYTVSSKNLLDWKIIESTLNK